jgi:hypothetical protein
MFYEAFDSKKGDGMYIEPVKELESGNVQLYEKILRVISGFFY